MRIPTVTAILGCALLAACGTPRHDQVSRATALALQPKVAEAIPPGFSAVAPKSQKDFERIASDKIKERLRDPDSAKFTFRPYKLGAVQIGRSTEPGYYMCGTVNAKNGYGGYTGAKDFYVRLEANSATAVDSWFLDDSRFQIANDVCSALGLATRL